MIVCRAVLSKSLNDFFGGGGCFVCVFFGVCGVFFCVCVCVCVFWCVCVFVCVLLFWGAVVIVLFVFVYFFNNLISINQTEGSTIPTCPSLSALWQGSYLINYFFENLCPVFVCVCFWFTSVSRQILWILKKICGLMTFVRNNKELDWCLFSSPGVILCGWLSSKRQLIS